MKGKEIEHYWYGVCKIGCNGGVEQLKKIRIYMDTCCYNRPFDDQRQERIRIESEAVLLILNRCQIGIWNLIGSEVLDFEISKIKDPVRKYKVSALYSLCHQKIIVNESVRKRALNLQSGGFPALDALHIACAEFGADVMLTTDDDLIKFASKSVLNVRVENPCIWLMEVLR